MSNATNPPASTNPADPATPAGPRAYETAEVDRAREALRDTRGAQTAIPEAVAGAMISGRYKLLESIGEGGMGVVWMAEQRVPVKRLVALKLIKAGMDSRAVLTRFEAERQALAMMDHPNIARVFDGGTTDRGHPYFVMELVKGLPLTRYCDGRRMSVRDRLELFSQVCSAVQHAHQKGIIHRDLKPGNVLVTETEGTRPLPKVIDFGLAKALGGSSVLTEHTMHTAFGAVAGTPLYMAPEQLGISALDVDTRADIYALGVILYELLTGTTPHEQDRLKQAAWDEVRRVIREEEPPRPSLRISQSATLPSLAATRDTEPARLSKLVAGELDWIVMKALDKDRHRRYGTASDLVADLQRHLTGEPIVAAPPSAVYWARKFVRKHKVAFAAAATVAVLLGIGGTGTVTQMLRAQRAEKEAVSQRDALANQTSRVNQALTDLVTGTFSPEPGGFGMSSFGGNANNEGWTLLFRHNRDRTKTLRVLTGKIEMAKIEELLDQPQPPIKPGTLLDALSSTVIDATYKLQEKTDAAETEAYVANLALGQAAMQADRWPEARQRLDACPKSKRGWEWLWLNRASQSVIAHLPVDAYSVVFSPDGKHILAETDSAAICFNADGVKLFEIPHKNEYLQAQFSPDGKTILGSTDKNTIQLFALDGSPIGKPFRHDAKLEDASFGSNGKLVATVDADRLAHLWSIDAIEICKPIPNAWQVNFSPDGKSVLVRADESARLWSIDGTPVSEVMPYNGGLLEAAFSRDGRRVLNRVNQTTLQWFDTNGKPAGNAMSHDEYVDEAALSADGERLVTVSNAMGFKERALRGEVDRAPGSVQLWDTNGEPVGKMFSLDRSHLSTARFSDDGTELFIATGWELKIIDAADGRVIRSIRLPAQACDVHSGPGETIMSSCGVDRTIIQVWNRSGQPIAEHHTEQSNAGGLEVSPNGLILSRSWSWGSGSARPTILDPQAFAYRQIYSLDAERELTAAWQLAAGASPTTGPTMASAPKDELRLQPMLNEIKIIRDGKEIATINRPGGPQLPAGFTPDGSRLVTASDDRSIRFWDTHTWRELVAIPVKTAVAQFRFTPDGTRLIIDFADGSMEIWDTRDYAERQKDRDARFAVIPAAKEYVQKLLATDTPTDKLKEVIRSDSAVSVLFKLAAIELAGLELSRVDETSQRTFEKMAESIPLKTNLTKEASHIADKRVRDAVLKRIEAMTPEDEAKHIHGIAWEAAIPGQDQAVYQRALVATRAIVVREPQRTFPKSLVVLTLYRLGQHAAALHELQVLKTSDKLDGSKEFLAMKAMVLHANGQTDPARATLDLARMMPPVPTSYDDDLCAEATTLILGPPSTQPTSQPATRP